MPIKLTPRQEKALLYIRDHSEKIGSSPTLREICRFMGYKSVGSAQDIIAALRKKGFLETPNRQVARAFRPTIKGRSHGRSIEREKRVISPELNEFLAIPCLGAVPAGNPVEAIENNIDKIHFSKRHLKACKNPDNLFALKASGYSMVNAGILDGDWLIVSAESHADSGAIVVARFFNGEATIKRLVFEEKDGWYLKPENPDFTPIYAKDNPFEIIGRLVGLQRMF